MRIVKTGTEKEWSEQGDQDDKPKLQSSPTLISPTIVRRTVDKNFNQEGKLMKTFAKESKHF